MIAPRPPADAPRTASSTGRGRHVSDANTAVASPTLDARRFPLVGALLVASSLLAAVGSITLTRFGWPGVLDEPARIALPAFARDATAIRVGFYLQLVSSLLLIPAAIGVQAALTRATPTIRAFTTLGIVGAVFQLLGWIRWPLVVPGLAQRYLDPTTEDVTRQATGAAYDLLNAYAGGAVGEHLGWLLQGAWAIALGVIALTARGVPRWVGWVGLVSAVAWVPLIVPQPFIPALGGATGSAVAFTAYSIWFTWVAVLGVVLATRRIAPPS